MAILQYFMVKSLEARIITEERRIFTNQLSQRGKKLLKMHLVNYSKFVLINFDIFNTKIMIFTRKFRPFIHWKSSGRHVVRYTWFTWIIMRLNCFLVLFNKNMLWPMVKDFSMRRVSESTRDWHILMQWEGWGKRRVSLSLRCQITVGSPAPT